MTTAYDRAKEFSENKLEKIRNEIRSIPPAAEIVLTCGSFALREASGNSDIDYFIVTTNSEIAKGKGSRDARKWVESVKSSIASIVDIGPAEGGPFANVKSAESVLSNIGGENDSNQTITRRMLFLLEGEWLFNEDGLRDIRRRILERYIASSMTDHQLALFLLNDIIRYYRTIAVDYEFKTNEGKYPKPWGIRNIKLVFSRKLLYASGLFSVAITADRTRDDKIQQLERLFYLPVIDRMIDICGTTSMESVLQSYNHFLDRLENADVRDYLKSLTKEGRSDPLFRELKNEGHHFTRELLKLFENTFDSTHPIRRAVLF